MHILVIGRRGQLAHALAEIAPDDLNLTCAARPEIDLARPETIAPVIARTQPDVVINAAAFTAVDLAESQSDLAWRINAEGVDAMARATARQGAALLHLSTDYVFDGSSSTPWRETDRPNPLGTYGRTKLAGELMAMDQNPRTAILRTAWVHAPWGQNFVRTMLRAARARPVLRVVADQVGAPTSALDLARACLTIAPRLARAAAGDPVFGITHCTNRGTCSWAGFAETIFASSTRPMIERITTHQWPTPAPRPACSVLDCTRLQAVFGVTMPPWEAGLATTLRLLGHPQLVDA